MLALWLKFLGEGVLRHDDALVRAPGSLKIAQAGNPERWVMGVGRSFMNWDLRQMLKRIQSDEGRRDSPAIRYWERSIGAKGSDDASLAEISPAASMSAPAPPPPA